MNKLYRFRSLNRRLYVIFNNNYKVSKAMTTLESLKFDNLALKLLPIDPEEENYVRTVKAACFSKVKPTPVENPKLVALSPSALGLLDLNGIEIERKELIEYFCGNKLLPGSEPAAHCYCGHQFGRFAGQLGDGAAIYLGEILNSRNERWEIQLKGAGTTPYSRTADGRKVLRSSIREFLCSEAMYFLGIPTSRAGTCITTQTEVYRDIFYDGHSKPEKCTVVLRIAPTFLRFGSFEITNTMDPVTRKFGPSVGRNDILEALLNYAIETFYPEISTGTKDQEHKYMSFFNEVVIRTAKLVALWQSIGFCHGVLNTDNMSIMGFTLDYGPYGFLDMYNPYHVCNASDEGGRYSFIKQPEICLWNLQKLAESLQKILPLDKSLPLLEQYTKEFQTTYLNKMQDKLGLISKNNPEDKSLIEELLNTMEDTGADFTNTFFCFSFIGIDDVQISFEIAESKLLKQCYPLEVVIKSYNPNMHPTQLNAILRVAASQPEVIDSLEQSGIPVKRILFLYNKFLKFRGMTEDSKCDHDKKLWKSWLQKYKQRIEIDIENYNGNISDYRRKRLNIMKISNPSFILRNYILQDAIEKAENEDYSQVRKLLKLLENPYENTYFGISNSPVESCKIESAQKDLKSSMIDCQTAPSSGLFIKVS